MVTPWSSSKARHGQWLPPYCFSHHQDPFSIPSGSVGPLPDCARLLRASGLGGSASGRKCKQLPSLEAPIAARPAS